MLEQYVRGTRLTSNSVSSVLRTLSPYQVIGCDSKIHIQRLEGERGPWMKKRIFFILPVSSHTQHGSLDIGRYLFGSDFDSQRTRGLQDALCEGVPEAVEIPSSERQVLRYSGDMYTYSAVRPSTRWSSACCFGKDSNRNYISS